MERYDLDETAAFAVLTRLASATGRKVRDVAIELVGTGRLPAPQAQIEN